MLTCPEDDHSTIHYAEQNGYELYKPTIKYRIKTNMTNVTRLFKSLYNIARVMIIGWYELFNHMVDSLERYENTCKKREKSAKTTQKAANPPEIKPPCL
jgi:hypothetical protein